MWARIVLSNIFSGYAAAKFALPLVFVVFGFLYNAIGVEHIGRHYFNPKKIHQHLIVRK